MIASCQTLPLNYPDVPSDEDQNAHQILGTGHRVDVKAGQTPSGDMLDSVTRIRETFESISKTQAMVHYGGEMKQTQKQGLILPWKLIQERTW